MEAKYKFAKVTEGKNMAIVELNHLFLEPEMVQELLDIYRILESKESLKYIATIGSCAGADLKAIWRMMQDNNTEKTREALEFYNSLTDTIAASSKITIGGMKGFCLGGGAEIYLAHKIRIAFRDLAVGFPEIGLGLIPGMGGTQRLPRIIGTYEAALMVLGGGERNYSAEQAHKIGLADAVAEGDFLRYIVEFSKKHASGQIIFSKHNPSLDIKTVDRAEKELHLTLERKSPHAVSAIKKALVAGVGMNLADALKLEQELFVELLNTEEAKIGVGNSPPVKKLREEAAKREEHDATVKPEERPASISLETSSTLPNFVTKPQDAASVFCERELAPRIRELLTAHLTPPATQKSASAQDDFSEQYDMWRDTVRKFCEEKIWPKITQMEKERRIFPEIIAGMAEIGMFGCCFPEKYGGAGLGKETYVICMEELGWCFGSMPTFYGSSVGLALTTLDHAGNHEQKMRYLAPAIEGKRIGAFALSEPGAGSDPAAMKTRARPEKDCIILDGKKRFVSTGKLADFLVTFAQTDPLGGNKTQVALIVDKNMPGVSITREHIDKVGLWASDTVDFAFDNVKVPLENQLGDIFDGFKIAMRTLNPGRIGLGAANLGMMKIVRELSMKEANTRIVSGKPLINSELYMQFIANISRDIYLTECAVYDAIRRMDKGEDVRELAAIIKYAVPSMLGHNVDDAFRFFGGDSFSDNTHLMAIAYRDKGIQDIYEGPKEINLLLIFKEVFKRFMALMR
ncbi:MAG: acyl-CoA dehydrogenase family protein [Candidatus Sungbacteria bacterium]|nr:acyl-CoA dehydrogenase family protein [Candidatus Sungbacteria bacterium]